MEQIVRVVKTHSDGTAQVLHTRQSACSGDCHKCSGCGAAQQRLLLTANNPIHAKVGDRVILYSESASVLKAAAILYLLPLGIFLAFYIAGQILWQNGISLGIAGFVLAIGVSVLYDRKVLKNKETVYTITGYAQEKRGDHID